MKPTVTITDRALRELVGEALDSSGWGVGDAMAGANVNPVVDPSAAVVDPVNADFTPQNKVEFAVAMDNLVKTMPDPQIPVVYAAVKKAIAQKTEKEEASDADKQALLGGSQEAIDAANKQKKHEGRAMTTEQQLRQKIRDAIAQLREDVMTPMPKAPVGLDEEEDPADVAADADEDEPTDKEGRPKKKHGSTKAFKKTAIGNMADVSGATFEQIAKEFGFSVAAAKGAVDKALDKARFMATEIEPDDLEIMALQSMNDYIRMLAKTGELTASDVQLMKDHPSIVRELAGWREFFHNYIRKARKGGDVSTFGEAIEPGSVIKLKSAGAPKSSSPPKSPGHTKAHGELTGKDLDVDWGNANTTKAKTASGKDVEVDWGGFAEADDEDLDEKAPPGKGEKVVKALKKDKKVRNPWAVAWSMKNKGELDEETEADKHHKTFGKPAPHKGEFFNDKSLYNDYLQWVEQEGHLSPNAHSVLRAYAEEHDLSHENEVRLAKMLHFNDMPRPRAKSGMAEAHQRVQRLLNEDVGSQTVVMEDTRGPYVSVDGVTARPGNPNHTQYRAGTKVRCFRGRPNKGTVVVEMPNGEKWVAKKRLTEEVVKIGGMWGKTVKDPRGMRIKQGGVLTDSEISGGGRPNETPRAKVKLGDIVQVIKHVPGNVETETHQADSGWWKIRDDQGRVGWIAGNCAEPVTEH